LFGDRLYVELQRHGIDSESAHRAGADRSRLCSGLAAGRDQRAVFRRRDDYEAQDALLCIAEGALIAETEREQLTPEHRFKTRAEMAALFADLPEATDNQRRDRDALRLSAADAQADPAALFGPRRRGGRRGAGAAPPGERGPGTADARARPRARAPRRIIARGSPSSSTSSSDEIPGYFLIVADFIQWAKAQGIPVGPGRGSGAGSLVAYALTITDLDPIRFGLLFERFLNPERVSMPDFDIDFCQDRRDEVIAYVRERYGADRVAQIITFGSFLARGVLRNVGRVLEMPLGQVDKLAKLVPQNPASR
jgi:DNA polymerase-3 subunit alpha